MLVNMEERGLLRTSCCIVCIGRLIVSLHDSFTAKLAMRTIYFQFTLVPVSEQDINVSLGERVGEKLLDML